MLNLPSSTRIFVASKPVDMRNYVQCPVMYSAGGPRAE